MWNFKKGLMVMGAALLVSGSMALAEGGASGGTQSGSSDQVLAGPKTHQKGAKKDGAGDMGGGKFGEGRGEFLKETLADLNLTADQKTKIDAMMADFHQKMEAFRTANESKIQALRDQAKQARQSGDKDKAKDLMGQIEALWADAPKPKDLITNIKTVLTPDQAATLDAKIEAKKKQFAENHPEAAKKIGNHKNKGGDGSGAGSSTPSNSTNKQLNF